MLGLAFADCGAERVAAATRRRRLSRPAARRVTIKTSAAFFFWGAWAVLGSVDSVWRRWQRSAFALSAKCCAH